MEERMGSVFAEITIKNYNDLIAVEEGRKSESEVRSITVNALVDTGAGTLVINEEVSQKLGLNVFEVRQSTLADGSKHLYKRMEGVSVHWKNRDTLCIPTMVPTAEIVLLGAIPLEDMDLIVDPKEEKLTGRHGDEIVQMIF